MDKINIILEALDEAFEKSAKFQKGERYDQMKEVYQGLRDDIIELDVDVLSGEMYKRAIDVKAYMKLFWEVTDTDIANKAYKIKIKALGHSKTLTYGHEELLSTVMVVLNLYLESLTNEEIIKNEEALNDPQYLTEKVHESLHNEKWDNNSL